jgi:hypothetical protein
VTARTVVAADSDLSLSTPLTCYYAEEGTPPGRWLGTGFVGLGGGRLAIADRIRHRVERLPGELGPAGRAEAVAQIEAEEVARGCVGQDQFGHEFGCATWGAAHVVPVECGVRAGQRYRWYRIDRAVIPDRCYR